MNIDIELARKVLSVVDAGLVKGMGIPEPGQMCVEAAVNYAMGAPHGDEPACVAPSLRRFKIRLNDAAWSSDKARAAGLRRLAIAQLGSAGVLDEKQFAVRCDQLTIQTWRSRRSLAFFAEGVVRILIDMKAPGCEFLYLTETITPYFARPS